MAVTRRKFLVGTAAIAALPGSERLRSRPPQRLRARTQRAVQPASTHAAPSQVVIALNRMAYGPRPGDMQTVTAQGLAQYIEQQLNPQGIDDSACDVRLNTARLRISYGTGATAVDELRPFTALTKPVPELWKLRAGNMDYQERIRPFTEVWAATLIRAVCSKRQLQEVLVDFWHNHFNVHATSDSAITATFPAYDRDVIRKNCLGNFRVFLEDVAKSTAMLYYLDNVSNRASGGEGGNENFARELFELHTLGADNYLKFYDDRSEIGTDADGNARGYIDDDVYEAARCFSGWTVANGHWERRTLDSGEFLYDASWHDTAQKIVLSPDGRSNIARNQPALGDGRKVLDLLARHRGTARTICTKLCRRLISDYPPSSIVEAAVTEWMAARDAPDQIKRVVRVILNSEAFKTTWGEKIKRPVEALVSYLRATNAELANDTIDPAHLDQGYNYRSLMWQLGGSGHKLFEWAAPTGHPDLMDHWASTNGLLRRWNLTYALTQSWGGAVTVDLKGQTPAGTTCTQIVDFWIARLCGFVIDPTVRKALIDFMAYGGDVNQPPRPTSKSPDWNDPKAIDDRLISMVQLLAMCPDFQKR